MFDIDVRKLRLNNGKTIEQLLKSEADRMLKILKSEISQWYSQYRPIMYERTYSMRDSIYIDDLVHVDYDTNRLSIDIRFNSGAYSKSLFGNGTINKLYLMDHGYSVKKDVWFKDIPNFGSRGGGYFLESAISRFNRTNSLGLKIRVDFPDKGG